MNINTQEHAAIAADLLASVGNRCEVAVRSNGYGIHVSGPLVYEDGGFSVTVVDSAGEGQGCAVFEPHHVQAIHRSRSGALLVALKS